jgi:isocitrate dehydrogenase (NAD+)
MARKIIVLDGDQTGQELLAESLRVLAPDVIRFDLEFIHYDLSLENRRATNNEVVYEAGRAMRQYHLALKAATITPEGKGDVGSPNRILREEINAEVILRTGRRIPGVRPIAGVYAPISVVRMARDDAYGAKEWREGEDGSPDEMAYRTEKISRRVCRAVANLCLPARPQYGGQSVRRPQIYRQPHL